MAVRDIKAKTAGGEPVTCKYDFGDSLEDLIALCDKGDADGNAVVLSNAVANMTIAIQDVIRAGLKAEKSQAEIQKEVSAWTPGIKKRGKSKSEKLKEEFESLSAEEKQEMLARLTAGTKK